MSDELSEEQQAFLNEVWAADQADAEAEEAEAAVAWVVMTPNASDEPPTAYGPWTNVVDAMEWLNAFTAECVADIGAEPDAMLVPVLSPW